MRAIGIVLAGGNSKHVKELSNKRAIVAMPIAGSYRSTDFVLSNVSNSHIQCVAVFTQYNLCPLNGHFSSPKQWDLSRKQRGLFVSAPTIVATSNDWYRGTADALYQNLQFLKNCHEPYVAIISGDCVYKLDYDKVLEYHIEKKADITVVCKEASVLEDLMRLGVVETNGNNRITQFDERPTVAESRMISYGVYIVRRRQLIEFIEKCVTKDRYDFVRDTLVRYKNLKRIYVYKLDSYWSNIASVESYFKTNTDFLRRGIREYFFRTHPEVYTRTNDLPPVKYNLGAEVRNSLISSGCILNGRVENSVLFRKMFVGQSCVIRNSVILSDVYIGNDTVIENCIVESRDTPRVNTRHTGTPEEVKIVTEKNERYAI